MKAPWIERKLPSITAAWRDRELRRLVWFAVKFFVAPVTVLLFVYVTWDALETFRLNGEIERIRRTGAPVSPEECIPAAVPDEENGAPMILEAGRLIKGLNLHFQWNRNLQKTKRHQKGYRLRKLQT